MAPTKANEKEVTAKIAAYERHCRRQEKKRRDELRETVDYLLSAVSLEFAPTGIDASGFPTFALRHAEN